jgi:hypothetical protein
MRGAASGVARPQRAPSIAPAAPASALAKPVTAASSASSLLSATATAIVDLMGFSEADATAVAEYVMTLEPGAARDYLSGPQGFLPPGAAAAAAGDALAQGLAALRLSPAPASLAPAPASLAAAAAPLPAAPAPPLDRRSACRHLSRLRCLRLARRPPRLRPLPLRRLCSRRRRPPSST